LSAQDKICRGAQDLICCGEYIETTFRVVEITATVFTHAIKLLK